MSKAGVMYRRKNLYTQSPPILEETARANLQLCMFDLMDKVPKDTVHVSGMSVKNDKKASCLRKLRVVFKGVTDRWGLKHGYHWELINYLGYKFYLCISFQLPTILCYVELWSPRIVLNACPNHTTIRIIVPFFIWRPESEIYLSVIFSPCFFVVQMNRLKLSSFIWDLFLVWIEHSYCVKQHSMNFTSRFNFITPPRLDLWWCNSYEDAYQIVVVLVFVFSNLLPQKYICIWKSYTALSRKSHWTRSPGDDGKASYSGLSKESANSKRRLLSEVCHILIATWHYHASWSCCKLSTFPMTNPQLLSITWSWSHSDTNRPSCCSIVLIRPAS